MPLELAYRGHGGDALAAPLWLPDGADGCPGVVLAHGAGGPTAHERDVAARFAAAGFAVALPDLHARGDAARALSDVRSVGDLDGVGGALGERPEVDARRLAAVGYGAGGTLAFVLGCKSTRIAAVVDCDGPLVYPDLSADRPVQPLELALNLSCPVLVLAAERDAALPPEHLERAREVLSQFFRHFDIVTYPGATQGFYDDRLPAHDAGAARDAWERTLAFLGESLEP